jgi:predicted glutamine amidotransferase
MCQLLGMNCNVPTDVCFSFSGFHRRGGATDKHGDGWGIAFYEGPGCRLFIDTKPASESPVAQLVKTYPIHSLNVIAHIRKATVGGVALENTHPFVREMWGRYWAFAHNGTLKGFEPKLEGYYRPVGATDSERAFCYVLETLRRQFPYGQPGNAALYEAVGEIAAHLAPLGEFNFLLSNGELLFAHCATSLGYIARKAPFSKAHLVDDDYEVDFNTVTTPRDKVAVIATKPLTDNEVWTAMSAGQLLLFRDGEPVTADRLPLI